MDCVDILFQVNLLVSFGDFGYATRNSFNFSLQNVQEHRRKKKSIFHLNVRIEELNKPLEVPKYSFIAKGKFQ